MLCIVTYLQGFIIYLFVPETRLWLFIASILFLKKQTYFNSHALLYAFFIKLI